MTGADAGAVLELSLREATQLGQDHIGAEHILLGLVREGDGVAAQVLVKLGADLNRVRQQVIQLVQGRAGEDVTGAGSGLGKPARAQLPDVTLTRASSLDRRVAAIELWVGMRPDLDQLDQEIAQVRREKEAAIDRQDFEASAALRDQERQLLAPVLPGRKEWTEAAAGRMTLAQELGRVNAELARLRAILRARYRTGDDAA